MLMKLSFFPPLKTKITAHSSLNTSSMNHLEVKVLYPFKNIKQAHQLHTYILNIYANSIWLSFHGQTLLSCTNFWGLTQHRLSPKLQIHSIKHLQTMQNLLKLCEQTGERVRTEGHMEIILNKLLFETLYFPLQPFFDTNHWTSLSLRTHSPNHCSKQFKSSKWCALPSEAKTGIINKDKVLWKSVKQLSVVIPTVPLK